MGTQKNIAIIGGGPSGLMAAEIIAKSGHFVTIYDRMPSLGRKFLMAGRGGLNLTHSEDLEQFTSRYGEAEKWLSPYIQAFSPSALRKWCEELGQTTFIGSSGRIFPKSMKAAPLLRACLIRLGELGVSYRPRNEWQGWEGDSLKFVDNNGKSLLVKADATLLALGGASWPRLGSNGNWVKILSDCGVGITPLKPANCGFITKWSEHFCSKFAGVPLKSIAVTNNNITTYGELMITEKGLEGGAIYALSSKLREAVMAKGNAILQLDLRPNISVETLTQKLQARGSASFSTYLKKTGFSPVAINLLREIIPADELAKAPPATLASFIKTLPITITATTDITRAISSAGGIKQNAVDEQFMLHAKPGVFAAGEMLDWEAPTGGYLLQACFSTAVAAANGILNFCKEN